MFSSIDYNYDDKYYLSLCPKKKICPLCAETDNKIYGHFGHLCCTFTGTVISYDMRNKKNKFSVYKPLFLSNKSFPTFCTNTSISRTKTTHLYNIIHSYKSC